MSLQCQVGSRISLTGWSLNCSASDELKVAGAGMIVSHVLFFFLK